MIRALSLLSFAVVSVSAVIGIVSESETAFVAQNMVGDFIVAVVCVGSIVAHRPFIGAIAREVAPGIRPVMEIDHPVFVRLTLGNAAVNVFSGIVRVLMLETLSTGVYVVVSRAALLPLTIGYVILCYREITRAAIRVWPADMPPPPEWKPHDRRG